VTKLLANNPEVLSAYTTARIQSSAFRLVRDSHRVHPDRMPFYCSDCKGECEPIERVLVEVLYTHDSELVQVRPWYCEGGGTGRGLGFRERIFVHGLISSILVVHTIPIRRSLSRPCVITSRASTA
jgi:hypothetical protein